MNKIQPLNIEISTREYRDLLDILHIADVVMSGHRRKEDQRTARHRAVIQKLYAHAQGEGLDGLIRHKEGLHPYAPTQDFEESTLAHAVIEEFAEHVFWDQLIDKLSVRDAAETAGGMDHLNALSESERQAVETPIRQRYIQEFTANGIANLEVIERFSGEGMPVRTSD
ncbi:MAG: hypothetical protein A2010_10770 [Nitrospirae bacterium GWD2_57_9]|nr:MAG: hypothetical protein A2010_10770 [Nitrospirae bacterium GWD2_57_9]